MALDHYVPQVHLKQFCLQDTGRLLAMRKSDGKTFEPSTRNVCGIHEGNTNGYLVNDRAIEGFLKEIEPLYIVAVRNLEAGKIDNQTIFTIAGFVSAVYSCSPTAMRLHTPQLKELLGMSAELMDRHGLFDESPVPAQLGANSLTELLDSGKVQFKIDPKYPQAVTIAGVLELARVLGNSAWDILINKLDDSPFLTSDFPIGLEPMGRVNVKVVPLTPTVAIRIVPNLNARDPRGEFDLRFRGFRWRKHSVNTKEVAHINRTIVQCAEDLVFCCSRLDWFETFVRRNSLYQLTTMVDKIPSPDGGRLLVARQRIVRRSA